MTARELDEYCAALGKPANVIRIILRVVTPGVSSSSPSTSAFVDSTLF